MFVDRKTLAADAPDDFDPDVSVLVAKVVISVLNQVSVCVFFVLTFITYWPRLLSITSVCFTYLRDFDFTVC